MKCNEVSFIVSLNEIRYYELSIASGEDSNCSSDKEFSTNLVIDGDKHEKNITIQKSVENITIGNEIFESKLIEKYKFCVCLLYTSPSPRDATLSRMPSSA